MTELIQWGKQDRKGAQGSAWRGLDRRWTCHFSGTHDTVERDGKMAFDGIKWASETGRNVSFPAAVVDDYGALVPVPIYTY